MENTICDEDCQRQQNVGSLLKEMRSAYDQTAQYEYMNSDYAEYAAMALHRFRKILGCEDLTSAELANMLRLGMNAYRLQENEGSWSEFLAAHISGTANEEMQQAAIMFRA